MLQLKRSAAYYLSPTHWWKPQSQQRLMHMTNERHRAAAKCRCLRAHLRSVAVAPSELLATSVVGSVAATLQVVRCRRATALP